MDVLQVLTFLLAASAPLAAYLLHKLLRRGRQEPSHVSGKEPPGDPALRAALAAARGRAREEHSEWEAEFCAALGVRLPQAGDPYNLVTDMAQLETDLAEQGVIYGADAVTYLRGQFARGGHIRWQGTGGVIQHKDLPDCACFQCDHQRALLRNGHYLKGQQWN